MLNIYNNFWRADDGRVYGSAKQIISDESDPDYVAWSQSQFASPWPRDVAGNQTDVALQDVLTPYSLFVNLNYYAAGARWVTEQSGISVTVSAGVMPIKTDDRSQAKINGARIVRENGSLTTACWHAADGNIYDVTKDDVIAISNQLQEFIHNTFEALDSAVQGITDGSITTKIQVDALFSAIPKTYG
jgi:hypothetical protein